MERLGLAHHGRARWRGQEVVWYAVERERATELLRLDYDRGALRPAGLGFHSDIDFDSLRGYPPFDELLRPQG
jgi:hypothetical protein